MSGFPKGTRDQAFVIYDVKTGEVVHGHWAILLPDDKTDIESLERDAIEQATLARGRDASGLRALRISTGDIEPGRHYRVDPKTARLEIVR
jgi:hypothetical protein